MDVRRIGGWAIGSGQRSNRFRDMGKRLCVSSALAIMLLTGTLTPLGQAGIGVQTLYAHGQTSASDRPNHFDVRSLATPARDTADHAVPGKAPAGPPQHIARGKGPMPMRTEKVSLKPDQPATFLGSDGRLEVDVPAGAISQADLTAVGGPAALRISQIAPASGSSAGGSGLVSFGMYLVQAVDAKGNLAAGGLRKPVTLTLHYGSRGSAVDVAHAFVVVNGALPADIASAPLAKGEATPTTAADMGMGAYATQDATLDAARRTLSVVQALSGPSTTISWNTDAAVATFGKPDPFNADLSAGGLTAGIPLDLPAGPGGLTPPLTLAYGSAGVSEQHNPQGAAGWVGEGWNLSLGSISWAEHNSNANCSGCGNGWEDTWQLSDPFGTAAELIPPNIQVATYYDDSPNGITPSPVQWHTAPETHAKIYSYVGSLTLPDGAGTHPPCFRVFLPNGVMEEFGCTADSLEYYYTPGMGDYISSWQLDLIADPQGNQIHITYQQDVEQKNVSGTNHQYVRDAVPATIEYDSPACHQQAYCTTNWQPLVRINLVAGHTVTRLSNTPAGCNQTSNVRCDDPLDLSGSNGLAAPDVQSGFALNDVQVLVRASAGTAWTSVAPLRDYQFTYEQNGPSTHTDPATGKQQSAAGYLDLTKVQQVGDDGQATLPPRTFTYATQTEYYEDDAFGPNPSTNCGPSWNTGTGSTSATCLLWSQSYDGNSRYLAIAGNGLGLKETFTWDDGRTNMHGVNGGGSNNADPRYCNTHQTGYPCDEADDENWGHIVLIQKEGDIVASSSSGNQTVASISSYQYTLAYPLAAQECPDCVAGMYWGNQNDGDYLDYYNGVFVGFVESDVTLPDGSKELHKYAATDGYGLYDGTVPCLSGNPCHTAPWWHLGNAGHGHETEIDRLNTNGNFIGKTLYAYNLVCPPSGVAQSPSWTGSLNGSPYTYTWDGNLVAALDHGNPVAACDIQTASTDTYTYDIPNGNWSNLTRHTHNYSYDSYGRVTLEQDIANTGGASPLQINHAHAYIWDDAVSATASAVSGTYLIDVMGFDDTEDSAGGNRYRCTYTSYDYQGYSLGSSSALTQGEATTIDVYTNCGTAPNFVPGGTLIETRHTYDAYGNQLTTTDPDANGGVAGHVGCTVGSSQYSECMAYDGTFATLLVSATNAKSQTGSLGYTQAAAGGFGLWPTSSTDVNGQITSVTYDPLGRLTSETLAAEIAGQTTKTRAYTTWCATSPPAASTPCVEIDDTSRLNSGAVVITRSFYDGWGHLAETRAQGPNNQDIVVHYYYDAMGRRTTQSTPYFVAAYTGNPGAGAFATPDASQPTTTTAYPDQLTETVTDPLSHQTTTATNVVCAAAGTNDSGCYEQTLATDAQSHETSTLADAFGRVAYAQTFTGNSPATYTVYATTKYQYDFDGHRVVTTYPDGTHTSTATYDAAGRKTQLNDPDLGAWTYAYDQDGNLTQQTDPRGAVGTMYAGYDGLDRQLWRNTTNSPTGAYVAYTYDGTAGGNVGVGRLTGETFASGPSNGVTGSYAYTYDTRGRETNTSMTLAGPNTPSGTYTMSTTYNDADQPVTFTYPSGEVVTTDYTANGWVQDQQDTQPGQTATYLVSAASYTAAGKLGALSMAGTPASPLLTTAFSYDTALRLTEKKTTLVSTGAVLHDEVVGYDAANNVTSATTTLPPYSTNAGGTEQQSFCYDEMNRLVWTGNQGTPTGPAAGDCGPVPATDTLPGGQYSSSKAYDTLGRMTNGPSGAATYGDSAHLDAATAEGGSWSGAYDAAGDMTCRSEKSSTACAGTSQTGNQLGYDNERHLVSWQDAPSAPTTTVGYAYDGEGQWVWRSSTSGGTTKTTIYVGGDVAEYTFTNGSSTGYTNRYTFAGAEVAVRGGTGWHYLLSDHLGTPEVQVSGTGAVESEQLKGPYGKARYASSQLYGYGFTGQLKDDTAGIMYFHARYYDQTSSQFITADSVDDGINRYAYVHDNPETLTDPTGHRFACDGGCDSSSDSPSLWSGLNQFASDVTNFATVLTAQRQTQAYMRAYAALQNSGLRPVVTFFANRDHLGAGGVPQAVHTRVSGSVEWTDPNYGPALESASRFGTVAKVLNVLGWSTVAADFAVQAHDYAVQHPQSSGVRALTYGAVHATISGGFAYTGGVFGAALGVPLDPFTLGGASITFGAAGGASGSWVGGHVADAVSGPMTDAYADAYHTTVRDAQAAWSSVDPPQPGLVGAHFWIGPFEISMP